MVTVSYYVKYKYTKEFCTQKVKTSRGSWLAVEYTALDIRAMSSVSTLGVESTWKKVFSKIKTSSYDRFLVP